ncbi:capsular polysaccharide biosynthesis protein [Gemmiger formicilis]|uniref:YveK family protein n=1 Tax=Gemmiger formicilis TaxID=745368 RepID=UPI00195EB094|nr:Wzz/FepE/Etk N-terminal domain-containing protein [Gemmiger formicilis]MBM6716085.1 capsular polysaccharide biosynthesis protein [Gemmiger formicilis]
MQRQTLSEYPIEPQVIAMRQEAEDTIDLVEVFYLFWGHLWQIVLCLILGAAVAFSYTYFLVTPLYQATAKIYIVSASNDSVVNLSDLQIGASLTADYQELLLSRPLLQDVINNLSLNMDYKTLESMISISNTQDTRILKILVTSSDPQQSADIANELVRQAGIYLPNIMETDPPNLVEDAIAPSGKSSPSYSKNTMLGGLAGAVLCCAVLLVRFLMNDTFVTPDDIAKYFGVQPLATIPEGDLGSFNSAGRKRKKKKNKHKKGDTK